MGYNQRRVIEKGKHVGNKNVSQKKKKDSST